MEKRFLRQTLIVDTREHRTKEYATLVKKCELEVVPGTLNFGDYCLNILDSESKWRYPLTTKIGHPAITINPFIAVERKQPIELMQCLTYDPHDFDVDRHWRFMDELQRAMQCGSSLIVAIDESLETMEDALKKYSFSNEDFEKLLSIYKKRMKLKFIHLKNVQGDGNLNKIIKILQMLEIRS